VPAGLEPGEQDVWLSRDAFHRHLDAAARHDRVLITFDDGNESDFEVALPALLARGVRAIFFIIAGRVDHPRYLKRDQLTALVDAGMTIGSHGMDHRPWRRMDHDTAVKEVVTAKAQLEKLTGRPIHDAACPYGSYDRKGLAALRAAGLRRVFTSDKGPAQADQWLQARTSIRRNDPPDLVDRLVLMRSQRVPLLSRAKQLLKRWR
jgi:peptidoglycan/xylan/chitin deacetylase (PgdA/CDA1 family)